MTISAEEYRKKAIRQKDIELPSGAGSFKIRSVTARDYLSESNIPLEDTLNVLRDKEKAQERAQTLWNSMSPERQAEQLKMNDRIVCRAVVSPKITEDGAGDSIKVDDLIDEDYYFIINEITELSFGGENLRPLSEVEPRPS